MTKRKSRIKFILISILVVIGVLLSVCKFDIPFTDKTYNGFANSIKLGLDLKGGVTAVYEASLPNDSTSDLDESISATIERLQNLITSEGFTEATVTKQGTSRIRIEVPDISDPEGIFDLIGQPASLEIRAEKDGEARLTGKDIKECYAAQDNELNYGVTLKFTLEGSKKFAELTKEKLNAQIYIIIGDQDPLVLTVNEEITSGETFISGGSLNTQADAEDYALKILSGTFDTELELLENNVVSPTLGADALKYGIIAGIIALVIVMIFMWIFYGDFGLLADLSLIIYVIITLFLLQAIPLVQLTLPGIAGIILSLGMAVDGNIIIFERIKDEYSKGKKIPFAVKSSFKKAFTPILDSNITTIIASIILYFLGTGSIKGFALTLLIGIVVSMFTTLVVTRRFVKLYLPLNSTNAKRLRLVKEVKDENK